MRVIQRRPVMWRIPPPNSRSSFEVSAFFGMVILMTFVCALKMVSLLSRNFITISMGSAARLDA